MSCMMPRARHRCAIQVPFRRNASERASEKVECQRSGDMGIVEVLPRLELAAVDFVVTYASGTSYAVNA